MGTRLPPRLLYTMAVVLAVLAMLALTLLLAMKISGLLRSGPEEAPREGTTTVFPAARAEDTAREPDCNGNPGAYRATGLKGTIVYTCEGDAYAMTLTTGEVALLFHGSRFVRQVAWSPDGSRVAYDAYAEGGIELTTLGSDSSRRLDTRFQAGDLDWSPDGWRIAFVNNSASHEDPDGRRSGDYESYGPETAFSPDGELLAAANGTSGKITLWRMSNGAKPSVYNSPGNPVSHLAFSADGVKLLAYDYALRVWQIER